MLIQFCTPFTLGAALLSCGGLLVMLFLMSKSVHATTSTGLNTIWSFSDIILLSLLFFSSKKPMSHIDPLHGTASSNIFYWISLCIKSNNDVWTKSLYQ